MPNPDFDSSSPRGGLKDLARLLSIGGALVVSATSSWAFALLGPINEPYQVPVIAHGLPGDIGAVKNYAEEYRRNTPFLYYAFDANFLDYFGARGVQEVEKAITIMNAVPKTSEMSRGLTEFPLSTIRENPTAAALGIQDIKSVTLNLLVEQMGLADPERFVWTLHTRFVGPGGCPADLSYSLIKRNFDPVPTSLTQLIPSSYVNGTLYTYFVNEICTGGNPLAEAYEVSIDPLDEGFTSVATSGDPLDAQSGIYTPGFYFTGLTRDDFGGLRYLMQTNNMNVETAGATTFSYVTNPTPQLLFSSNLADLAYLSLTNDPGTLQALFPDLVILSSSNYFVNVWVTNVTGYFTNLPWSPYGSPPTLVYQTNRTLQIQARYQHVFQNAVTLDETDSGFVVVPIAGFSDFSNRVWVTIATEMVTNAPMSPVGSPTVTYTTSTTYITNGFAGEFFVIPTNQCSFGIVGIQATFTNAITNILFSITNSIVDTNTPAGTNATGTNVFSATQYIVTYFTNHAFVTLPVFCPTNAVALRQGIEKVTFVRKNFDSLLGYYFEPFTNIYTLNTITNSRLVPEVVTRVVQLPDIIFTAQDLATGPADPPGVASVARGINFGTNALFAYPGLAGPGTIEPRTEITFNKVGPIYANSSDLVYFVEVAESAHFLMQLWGSYDGSTNPPVVYPNSASLEELENSILISVLPATLPAGTRFEDYETVNFTAIGASDPLTWTLSPTSPGLPPGLELLTDGTLQGIPEQDGTFDVVVRMTDAVGRYVDRSYVITINP